MSTDMQALCGGKTYTKMMDGKSQLRAIRYRLLALRHNCLSGAAFARSDAETAENEAQRREQVARAVTYETCAGWLESAVEAIPRGKDGE